MNHPSHVRRTANALAPAANARSRAVYAGKPHIPAAAPRVVWLDWLTWADPDGCYADADVVSEGGEPLTLAEAIDAVADLLDDA